MKKALLIIVPIIAIAVVGVALYNNKESKLEYYYDFDEIIHYKTNIDESDLMDIRHKQIKTTKDSMMLTMAWDYYRFPLNRAVAYLDSIDFKKQLIPVSKHRALKEIFKEKTTELDWGTACESVYRNIYVFKKNGKISGIAKLSYECGKSDIIGTDAYTFSFGQHDEFEELQELVK